MGAQNTAGDRLASIAGTRDGAGLTAPTGRGARAAPEAGPDAAELGSCATVSSGVGPAVQAAADGYRSRHGIAGLVTGVPRGRRPRVGPRLGVPRRLAATALVAILLLGGGVALHAQSLRVGDPVSLGTPLPDRTSASTPAGVVVVDVTGQVGVPGVVRLPAGSRVIDAVAAAGGSTPGADLAAINLARLLVDGEQLVVPAVGQPSAQPSATDGGLIDLNTASAAQLDQLPGVGPVLAGRIVAHRPFATVDELDEVSGVGPALLDRLRPLVRI